MSDYRVGQIVELNDGRKATIRYIGTIHVAEGQFVGVELAEGGGKNDGSVKGERYFDCPDGHGLFIRTSGIAAIISQPLAKPPSKAAPVSAKPRPTSVGTGKAGLKAPAARPSAPPSRGPVSSAPPAVGRNLTNTLASRTSRQSVIPSAGPFAPKAASTTPRPPSSSNPPASSRRPASVSQPPSKPTKPVSSSSSSTAPRRSPSYSSANAVNLNRSTTTRDLHAEKLEAKIQLLEKQRTEDRDKLAKLDQLQKDKERFEGLIQKLQGKCQAFHNENNELKSRLKEIECEVERLSRAEQEHDTILELATIDREMAEEKAEAAENEMEALRQKLEEYELELDIFRSEQDMYSGSMSEEEQEKAGYFILQRENERAKEALLKLHDITKAMEKEDKERIAELEKDLEQFNRIRQENGDLQAQVSLQERTLQDLRQQLDAALDWEDMVEDLSDQNQQFKEKIIEKDQEILDLQKLKEINDELELIHAEHENELRAELELKERELFRQLDKIEEYEEHIEDQNMLLAKFRDLVADLQSKMTVVESSKIMSEEQAKEVTNRFHEVMDLNRRLRHATTASTVKTIDMELQKLWSEQYHEKYDIAHLFISEDVPDMDPERSDAVQAYFRLKRIDSKAGLLKSLFEGLNAEEEMSIHEILRRDIIYKLSELKLTAKELWDGLLVCTPDFFAQYGRTYVDSELVERMLDCIIDCFRVDELKFEEIVSQIEKCQAVFHDIALNHDNITLFRPEYKPIHYTGLIRNSLEYIVSVYDVLSAQTRGLNLLDDPEGEIEAFLRRVSSDMADYKEGVVLITKVQRVVEALISDSLYPDPSRVDQTEMLFHVKHLDRRALEVNSFAQSFLHDLQSLMKRHTDGIPVADVAKAYADNSRTIDEDVPDEDNIGGGLAHMTVVHAKKWHDQVSDLINCTEIERGPAPWLRKAEQLQAIKKQHIDTEEKLQRLTAEHHAIVLQIKEREDIIETKELEIEHLRAKHREAASKAEELGSTRERVERAEQEKRRLLDEIRAYKVEIQQLKEDITESQRSEPVEPVTPVARGLDNNPVLKEMGGKQNGGFMVFLQAMRNENHWLRQRNNKAILDITIGNTLKYARERKLREQHIEQRQSDKANKSLEITLRMETLGTRTPEPQRIEDSVKNDMSPSVITSTPVRPWRKAPIRLSPIKTSLKWAPTAEMPQGEFRMLEGGAFEDLSPIEAEFPDEFEAECMEFSELGDDTLAEIVNNVMGGREQRGV